MPELRDTVPRRLVTALVAGSMSLAPALCVVLAPPGLRWDDGVISGLALVVVLAGVGAWLALRGVRGTPTVVLAVAILPWLACTVAPLTRAAPDPAEPLQPSERELFDAVAGLAVLTDDANAWTTSHGARFDPHRLEAVVLLAIVAALLVLSLFTSGPRRSSPLAGAAARAHHRSMTALGAIAAVIVALVIAGSSEPARDFARAAELEHASILAILAHDASDLHMRWLVPLLGALALVGIGAYFIAKSELRRASALGVAALASILAIVVAGDAVAHAAARARLDAIMAVPAVAAVRRCGGDVRTIAAEHIGAAHGRVDLVACVTGRRVRVGARHARVRFDETEAEAALRAEGAAHRSVTVFLGDDAEAEAVALVAAAAHNAGASEVFIAWPGAWSLRALRVYRERTTRGTTLPRSGPYRAGGDQAAVSLIHRYPAGFWGRNGPDIRLGMELSSPRSTIATSDGWVEPIENGSAGFDVEELAERLRDRLVEQPDQRAFFIAPSSDVPVATLLQVMKVAAAEGFDELVIVATGVRAEQERVRRVMERERRAAEAAYTRRAAELERRRAEVIARGGAPHVRADALDVRGPVEPRVIERVLQRQLGDVRECYARELSERPYLEGRMLVSFIIAPSGAIQSAAVGDSTMDDARVESCVVQAVRRWQFPPLAGGNIAGVNAPLELWRGARREE